MREHIIHEIRRLAALNGEQPPGQNAFARETGIAEHQWRGKFWARWGDALAEAGYAPNKWTERLSTEAILDEVVKVCRSYRRLPTQAELELHRKKNATFPTINTIKRHFGRRDSLIAALASVRQRTPSMPTLGICCRRSRIALPQPPQIVRGFQRATFTSSSQATSIRLDAATISSGESSKFAPRSRTRRPWSIRFELMIHRASKRIGINDLRRGERTENGLD